MSKSKGWRPRQLGRRKHYPPPDPPTLITLDELVQAIREMEQATGGTPSHLQQTSEDSEGD